MNLYPLKLHFFITVLIYTLLLLVACSKSSEQKDAVAQVGNSVLTLTRLQNQFPSEYKHLIKKEQYLDYIKRWMDDEILYQHALANKTDILPDLKEKINELKKKIVVEHYLNSELSDVNYRLEEAAIIQYYNTHQGEFLRSEPEVRLLQLKVKGDKLAWEIHNKIKGDNFGSLIKKYSIGPKMESIRDLPFYTRSELLPCIADPAFELRTGGISLPLKCDDGVRIIQVTERKKPGTLKNMSSVKEEISNLLAQKWQQRNIREKIDDLKKEIYFSSNLEIIP